MCRGCSGPWGCSSEQGPCSRGDSPAVLVTDVTSEPSRDVNTSMVPILESGRGQSAERSLPKPADLGDGRAGIQVFIFLLCCPAP